MNREKYTLKQSFRFFCKLLQYIWLKKKSVYYFFLLYFPAYILVSILQAYLPKAVLSELENGQTILHFVTTLAAISIPLFLSLFFRDKSKVIIQSSSIEVIREMYLEYARKFLYVEYPCLEHPEFIEHSSNAKVALRGRGRDSNTPILDQFLPILSNMLASFGTAAAYIFLISRLSTFLTAAVLVTSLGAVWASLKENKVIYDGSSESADALRKIDYIAFQTGNFSLAKDMRLYHMDEWLLHTIEKYKNIWLHYKSMSLKDTAYVQMTAALFMGIQNFLIYLFLLKGIFSSLITLSDFVFYAGASAILSNTFIEWSKQVYQLHKLSIDYGKFCSFLSYGRNEESISLPAKKEKISITLEQVSFRFPEMEQDLLHNLNFTVNYGEKLAIVGVNGAGKTTLMKLICGLLNPTEGRILLNGRDMSTIPPHERYTWFSCVFQDTAFLPITIAENISMQTLSETDEEKVWHCLSLAGMREKIKNTKDSLHAFMGKDIKDQAIDFSGGERQKLILARALYKDASVLILDEPTAALDPMAENDIYLKYAAFTENKTSFFVSHRLSSTRFCDRILLLDHGSICEEGTHNELLKKNGLYARMFHFQSHYYQEQEA